MHGERAMTVKEIVEEYLKEHPEYNGIVNHKVHCACDSLRLSCCVSGCEFTKPEATDDDT